MKIKRNDHLTDRTLGIAIVPDGREFPTMELPWNNNKVGASCIPTGHYKFKVDLYGRFQWFRLLNVPKRTDIECHLGTQPSHSLGCILMTIECLRAMQEFYNDPELEYVMEIT
jgi:hypothetical protein